MHTKLSRILEELLRVAHEMSNIGETLARGRPKKDLASKCQLIEVSSRTSARVSLKEEESMFVEVSQADNLLY